MTQVVFITLFVIVITISSCEHAEYSNAEVERCRTECPSAYCPSSERQNAVKENPDVCSQSDCKCDFNYRRAANGTCIRTQKCPPFQCSGPNEQYEACPSYCPTDCSQASPDGDCFFNGLPFISLMVVECSPACRCVKGYWRKNGKCVPYSECLTAVDN